MRIFGAAAIPNHPAMINYSDRPTKFKAKLPWKLLLLPRTMHCCLHFGRVQYFNRRKTKRKFTPFENNHPRQCISALFEGQRGCEFSATSGRPLDCACDQRGEHYRRHMLPPQETGRHGNSPPAGRHFGPRRRELAGAPQIYICLIRRLKGDHYQSFLLNCGSRRVWSICRRSLPGSALLFYIISLLPPRLSLIESALSDFSLSLFLSWFKSSHYLLKFWRLFDLRSKW